MTNRHIKYLQSLEAKGMKQICIVVPTQNIPEVKLLVAGMRKEHLAKRTLGINEGAK